MMTFSQSTGHFTKDSVLVAKAYSGNGPGLNNSSMQNVKMHGPLPQGKYTIQLPSSHPKLGPIAMALEPDPDNEMFGRGDFFLHGDNAEMNHTASDGCIILPRDVRIAIAGAVLAGDNQLEVTS